MTDTNPPPDAPTDEQESAHDQPAASNGPGTPDPSDRGSMQEGGSAGNVQPAPGDVDAAGPVADSNGSGGSKLVTVVEYATFGILSLLALVATFRFYFAVSDAIRIWFSSDFVPVFQATFNLVVLIAAAIGVSVLIRRIDRD